MTEFWDERYGSDEYVYGKNPNAFFKSWIDRLPAGRILLPGEGEGRNAVYAAASGWDVFAFDQSLKAREKALKLAAEHEVDIEYHQGSVLDIMPGGNLFDMIALVFFHLPPVMRARVHALLASHLKPGGLIVMEAFSQEQLGGTSGGPENPELLYTVQDIIADFESFKVLHAFSGPVILDEGRHHRGTAQVIRFVGKK